MSEAAQAQASAAISPDRDIKQERNALEDFDFSLPQPNGSSEQPPEPEAATATEPTATTETTTQPATNGPSEPDTATGTEAITTTDFTAQPATNGTSTPAGPAASPLTAPGSPTKRPIEDVETTIETPEAKRPKTEEQNHAPPAQPQGGSGPPLEDYNDDEDISLFVQNALVNINTLMDEFDPEGDVQIDADGGDAKVEEQAPISFIDEPSKFTHNQFLNALGNTAVAMLLLLSQKPHETVVAKLREADSEHRRHYILYQKTLEALRLHYSDGQILSASDYDLRSDVAGTIIQFVNLAQLGVWLLDGSPASLDEADKNLVKVFRDDRLGLPQQIVDLMMDIKTQRTINLVQSKDDKKLSEDELQGIFMKDAERQLEEHNITNLVHGSEKSITTSLSERVEELRNLTAEVNVAEKYATSKLLRKFCEYANNQLAFAEQLSARLGFVRPKFEEPQDDGPSDEDLFEFAQAFEKNTEEMIQNALAGLEDLNPPAEVANDTSSAPSANGTQAEGPKINGRFTDYKDFEALVAESTSNYVRTTLQGLSPTPYQPTVPTSTTESMAAQVQNANHLNSTQQQAQQNSYYPTYPQPTTEQQQQPQQHLQVPEQQPQAAQGHTLPPHQSCSSAQLYEKARQAALSRSTAHTRREGLHSTRRPWTQEEEKALMTGLDMVKGPHWSQILSLFGVNGSITDILRDRTQVQLKDKARNLKLFFLKTNSEMPYYLNTVTGELKTRAPTQAARKEAEDRARQASVEGMVNGGHHNRTQSAGVITPAHAASQAVAAAQRNSLPHSSPPQITYTQSSQATTPNGAAAAPPQLPQGYGTHAQSQVPRAQSQQSQSHTQESQPQSQQPTANGSHGGHHDQAVKDEPQRDLQAFDEQSIIEQLRRVTQDFPQPPTQESEPVQRVSSPSVDNTPGTQQSPAVGATPTTTASQPQPQQQHAPTPTQPQHVSPSPAPTQPAPSHSATPTPAPATQPETTPMAIALPQAAPVESSEPQPAGEVSAPTTEQAEHMPHDNMDPGTEDDVVGFDPAALMRDLEAVI